MHYRIIITNYDIDETKDFYFKEYPNLKELRDKVNDMGCYQTLKCFEKKDWPKEVGIFEHKISIMRHKKLSVAIRPFQFEGGNDLLRSTEEM